ncbi:hypothetical protein K432DRAFT_189286 [Lepidopterella palustris CBS 459.81]|uniref:Uncharacterized protein n=1 Tax=Lepidopterella palustris CBS 459.81 TaxID=1314670 RepID=A0A8E2JI80_9PEZI|nr:hypothetical protein K432DRAFT_189286 [Lepidopterella palustris CBS 459.81]
MMNPASAIHGYDTPHGFPTLSKTKSRPHSIDGVSGREIDGDDSQMPSEAGQSRYWYRPGKGVTHLQLFTSLAAPPGSGKNSIIDSAPVPLHALQPLNEADENPLSQKAATFIAQKRRLIGEGWPIDQVLGSEDIDSSVLRPKEIRKTPSTELTVCQWVVHMFEGMKEVKVPEKVAMTLLCVMFFRWSIFPSVEHYQRIPEWMRPTPTQTITPHAVWIDFIPWPEIRDAFINSPELAETPDAFEMLVINASVNWPWPLNEVISLRSNVDGVQLNKTFEQYVRDINNWSLSPVIVAVFPVLGDKAWIRPEKEDDEYLLDADSQEAVFGFQ